MSDESTEIDILTKYSEEFTKDTSIDELNLKERAITIVAIKHKWVGKLMRHKIDLKKLEAAKKKAVNKISETLAKGDVGLTLAASKKAAGTNELVIRIDDEIQKIELLIEYLEKVEGILNKMTFDIKNIIDIQKLETM